MVERARDSRGGRLLGEPAWLLAMLAGIAAAEIARPRAQRDASPDAGGAGSREPLLEGSPRELRRLPGIGEMRANAIARARWERRGNGQLDLDRVPGIGPRTLERIEAWVDASGE